MKTFSKDLLCQNQDNKLYLVKDGVLKNNTYIYCATTTPIITYNDGYIQISSKEWSDVIIKNDLDFSGYSTLFVEVEGNGTFGSWLQIKLFHDDNINEGLQYRGTTMSRTTFTHSTTGFSTDEILYIANTASTSTAALKVYNLWLEQEASYEDI